jgi:hypothetical protein
MATDPRDVVVEAARRALKDLEAWSNPDADAFGPTPIPREGDPSPRTAMDALRAALAALPAPRAASPSSDTEAGR